jgi:glycosyltransferase involved in cell wall biosynthesis
MGMLMLRELLRQGVEVDVYLGTEQTVQVPIEPHPGLRVIVRRSGWRWGRWYSRREPWTLLSSLVVRSLNSVLLSIRLLIEHRRRPYDAVFQLSQTELFLIGRARRLAPPIIVHPCTHAAGELRWHRAEQSYALRSERRSVHLAMRAMLALRSRIQPSELARADLVVGPSRRFVDLVHLDYGVPREKLRVLRHPVDLDRFTPNGAVTGPNRTLLFISRISARKGVAEIIELSHRLSDLSGSVRLLVVGSSTLWSDYRAHLADLNPAVAEYRGGVPTEEIPALLRSAAMLLVPSRYEPGSIVTGEALACGVPVVLSDEVGPGEVVAGPHVRIHRAGDADSLEAAVRSLLRALDDEEPALRAAARATAEEHFAASTIATQVTEMVTSVAGAGAP